MSKYKLTNIIPILFFFIALGIFLWAGSAHATKPKPPPKPTQPISQEQHQGQSQEQRQDQWQNAYGEAESASTANSESLSSASVNNDLKADGGSSDNAVAISNVYMSRAFAQDFPITHGCFVGVNGGGDKTTQSKSTGGFLGFTYLSNSCHMQALADTERDVELVARLRCGDRKYRKAIAFDAPKGTGKREHCIGIVKNSLVGAIEEEKRKLREMADQYKGERDNAVIMYEEQSKLADKLTQEVSEKRLVEATSK